MTRFGSVDGLRACGLRLCRGGFLVGFVGDRKRRECAASFETLVFNSSFNSDPHYVACIYQQLESGVLKTSDGEPR